MKENRAGPLVIVIEGGASPDNEFRSYALVPKAVNMKGPEPPFGFSGPASCCLPLGRPNET